MSATSAGRAIRKTGRAPTDHTRSLFAATILRAGDMAHTSGVVPTRARIGRRRPSTSRTCVSPVTHSRKSDMMGRLFGRCSRLRLSCESASTGALSSFASALSEREISEISVARFSPSAIACMSCR